MKPTNELLQDLNIRQLELNRDRTKLDNLVNRFGGRDVLLSVSFDCVQKLHSSEHIAPRSLECDFLGQPQEPQL